MFFFLAALTGKLLNVKKSFRPQKKVEEISQKNRYTDNLDDILAVANSFADSATSLEKMNLSDQRLSSFQIKLAQIYSGNAQSTRNFISAFESRDIPGREISQARSPTIGEAGTTTGR